MGPENTSREWVCLCFLRSYMTDHKTWENHPGGESVSVFPEKLHDWSWDLKTFQEVSLSQCFLRSCMTDHGTWKHIQIVSVSWEVAWLIMGPEYTFREWVYFCVSWEAAWLIMGPGNISSLWVCLCVSWEVTWLIMRPENHPGGESVPVFPEKLHDWSWDLKTHPDCECFLRSCMTGHGTMGPENTSRLWVHLCVSWEVASWCYDFERVILPFDSRDQKSFKVSSRVGRP